MAEAGSYVPADVRPPRLVEPTPGELKLLPPAAFRLWRALVRARDNGAEECEWFWADLRALARRAGIAYGTASNMLAVLRDAGLVATHRNRESRWIKVDRGFASVNALTTNCYLVPGTYRNDRGLHKVRFPAKPWSEYVARVRWGARRAAARVAAWRYEISNAQWNREWTKELLSRSGDSPVTTRRLGRRVVRSVYSKYSNSEIVEASEKALRDSSPSQDDAAIDDLISYVLEDDEAPGRPISFGHNPPLRLGVPVPSRPIDPMPRQESDIQWISTGLVAEQKAQLVIAGYRAAVEKIYGQQWWHYWKGDLKRAKHYDKFVKCGEVMGEKAIPAEHWAIWRLTWMKANIKQFAKKPPPIWVVMSAKQVSEKAGWFRNAYELPMPVFKADWVRREQLLRNEEARLFARGHKNPWACLDQWYVDKRAAEIRDGLVSPFDCYPDRHGSPWQAGPL